MTTYEAKEMLKHNLGTENNILTQGRERKKKRSKNNNLVSVEKGVSFICRFVRNGVRQLQQSQQELK